MIYVSFISTALRIPSWLSHAHKMGHIHTTLHWQSSHPFFPLLTHSFIHLCSFLLIVKHLTKKHNNSGWDEIKWDADNDYDDGDIEREEKMTNSHKMNLRMVVIWFIWYLSMGRQMVRVCENGSSGKEVESKPISSSCRDYIFLSFCSYTSCVVLFVSECVNESEI
jgi:hypothetical protein